MTINADFTPEVVLTAAVTSVGATVSASFAPEVTLSADAAQVYTQNAVLEILDDTLVQAPSLVTFQVTGGWPGDDVDIDIDGTVVLTTVLDSEGALAATSVPVSEVLGTVGSHTLTMTSLTLAVGYTTSDTFTVELAPLPTPDPVGDDADPVVVPEAETPTGVYRWVLQDLAPGGLGSYVFPNNPESMTAPHFQRLLTQHHTTSVTSGQYHVSEPGGFAVEWSFAGVCLTQAHYDALVAFSELPRRFYLIDHRNRAWKVTFTVVDFTARLRTNVNGGLTDWVHDYEVSALIYDQNWSVPQ